MHIFKRPLLHSLKSFFNQQLKADVLRVYEHSQQILSIDQTFSDTEPGALSHFYFPRTQPVFPLAHLYSTKSRLCTTLLLSDSLCTVVTVVISIHVDIRGIFRRILKYWKAVQLLWCHHSCVSWYQLVTVPKLTQCFKEIDSRKCVISYDCSRK